MANTKLNPHEVTWYKVLLEGKSCHGGNFTWSLPILNKDGTYTPGDWHIHKGKFRLCESGFHLTNNPSNWMKENCTVFVCEIDVNSFVDYHKYGDKIVVSKVRLISIFTGMIDINGDKHWYKNGQIHRDNDLPAIIYSNGTKEWYKNGLWHRDNDKPAVEDANGSKFWYKEGLLHREHDMPAIDGSFMGKQWYKNGKRHRDNDMPAVENLEGIKCWYKEGEKYHPKNQNDTQK